MDFEVKSYKSILRLPQSIKKKCINEKLCRTQMMYVKFFQKLLVQNYFKTKSPECHIQLFTISKAFFPLSKFPLLLKSSNSLQSSILKQYSQDERLAYTTTKKKKKYKTLELLKMGLYCMK